MGTVTVNGTHWESAGTPAVPLVRARVAVAGSRLPSALASAWHGKCRDIRVFFTVGPADPYSVSRGSRAPVTRV